MGSQITIDASQICLICSNGELKKELGTGFVFMRPNWVVTAAHVVYEQGLVTQDLYGEFSLPGKNKFDLKVLAIHFEKDIALLEFSNADSPCTKPLYPGYDELSGVNGLFVLGFTPTKGKSITVSYVHNYKKEFRERKSTEAILEFETVDVEPGSSGGPILGDGGVVLGVLINIFSNEENPNQKLARATSILNLVEGIEFKIQEKILHLIK